MVHEVTGTFPKYDGPAACTIRPASPPVVAASLASSPPPEAAKASVAASKAAKPFVAPLDRCDVMGCVRDVADGRAIYRHGQRA